MYIQLQYRLPYVVYVEKSPHFTNGRKHINVGMSVDDSTRISKTNYSFVEMHLDLHCYVENSKEFLN